MRRREFIALIGSAAALPLFRVPVARAQQPGRFYRLGILTGAARQAPRMVAFFDELKVLGFVEGQNLKIVADGFDLREDQFADVAATLAKAAPDVVFCVGNAASRAAQQSAYTGSYRRLVGRYGRRGFGALAGPSRRQYHRRQRVRERT